MVIALKLFYFIMKFSCFKGWSDLAFNRVGVFFVKYENVFEEMLPHLGNLSSIWPPVCLCMCCIERFMFVFQLGLTEFVLYHAGLTLRAEAARCYSITWGVRQYLLWNTTHIGVYFVPPPPRLPDLRSVIVLDRRQPGMHHFEDVMQAGSSQYVKQLQDLQKKISFDDPINIQFTSVIPDLTRRRLKSPPPQWTAVLGGTCLFFESCNLSHEGVAGFAPFWLVALVLPTHGDYMHTRL